VADQLPIVRSLAWLKFGSLIRAEPKSLAQGRNRTSRDRFLTKLHSGKLSFANRPRSTGGDPTAIIVERQTGGRHPETSSLGSNRETTRNSD